MFIFGNVTILTDSGSAWCLKVKKNAHNVNDRVWSA